MKTAHTKAPAKIYLVHAKSDHQFSSFHIDVMIPKEWSQDDYTTLLTFGWQSNADKRWDWYGIHTETRYSDGMAGNPVKLMKAALKLAEAMFEKDKVIERYTPQDFLARLEQLGYKRASYDGRVSKYVAMDDAIDPRLQRWCDNLSQDKCHVGALALDHDDAQRKMEKAWLDSVGKGYTKAEEFATWISAGRPVRRGYRDEPPTWLKIADMLNEEQKPKAEDVAQAA